MLSIIGSIKFVGRVLNEIVLLAYVNVGSVNVCFHALLINHILSFATSHSARIGIVTSTPSSSFANSPAIINFTK